MRRKIISLLATLGILGWIGGAVAGDTAAGKAIYDDDCAECHDADEFEGESVEDIKGWIEDIVAGKVEHRGTAKDLTPEQVDAIAAFFAAGDK